MEVYLAKVVRKDEDLGLLRKVLALDNVAFGDHSPKSGPMRIQVSMQISSKQAQHNCKI